MGEINDKIKSSFYESDCGLHQTHTSDLRAIDKGLLASTVENVKIAKYATKYVRNAKILYAAVAAKAERGDGVTNEIQ
jgi:hypothetical protein